MDSSRILVIISYYVFNWTYSPTQLKLVKSLPKIHYLKLKKQYKIYISFWNVFSFYFSSIIESLNKRSSLLWNICEQLLRLWWICDAVSRIPVYKCVYRYTVDIPPNVYTGIQISSSNFTFYWYTKKNQERINFNVYRGLIIEYFWTNFLQALNSPCFVQSWKERPPPPI